ncbi:hypothetical protein [Halobellus litoreus]|uniref:Uncharacterized protein n=1 Tax=Halobellus litoreus TaxID=755310 RepID=A0ABD6DZZ1_9EURY|nr:hypothetical protein [Halobellus litoreus]
MGDLRERYVGVEAVLGEVVVAREITGRLHRPKGEAEPWCSSTGDVEYVETEIALSYGATLCKQCYRPALAHLARMDASPVEDRLAEHDTPAEVETDVSHLDPPRSAREKVDALTAEVLVASGGADVYHAPTASGNAVCGRAVDDVRRRRVDQTPPRARPCKRCFTADVVGRYTGREAPEHAVVEATAARR